MPPRGGNGDRQQTRKKKKKDTAEDGDGGRRKGSRRRLGSKEEEESNSSQERKKRQKMELKKKVAEDEDSSNESTSSREMRRRQHQEDGSACYSEGDKDDARAKIERSRPKNKTNWTDTDEDSGTSGSREGDEIRSVENEGEGDDYDEARFLEQCVRRRYAASSRTGFRQRFRQLQKWLHRNAKNYLPLRRPFQKRVCIRWCHHQMKRRNAKGDLYGAGNLFAHIQMLKYKGFTKWHKPVPKKLELFFKNAHEAHRRRVMKRVDQCKQALPDSHAQNASWAAIQYACEKTHDWRPGREHDPRTNLFLTGSIQTISRGERVGKVPTMAFRMGHTGDHVCAGEGLSSKTNQKGTLSYDKRFWPNYKNGKMCFVTALGRHLASQRKNQLSEFLFMSRTEAKDYRKKLAASRLNKNHKESNVGPHLKFDRLIAKVFKKLPPQRRIAMGISKKKNFVGHCKRKGAFARVVEGDGPDANMIANRADHRPSNHLTYSARPIFGVQGSGGPPARHDITMSKLLAGMTQYTPEFNHHPPHWDSNVSDQVDWGKIVPCYEELSEGMQGVVPFAMAQVVYHYHKSNYGLSSSHDLFKSPLWNTHQELRIELYKALRGADTGQESVLSQTFSDKRTNMYLWTRDSHETITGIKKDIKDLKAAQKEQIKLQRAIMRRLDGHHCNPVDAAADVNDDEAHEQQQFEEPKPLEQRSDPKVLVLPAIPAVFEIEDGISVETAWHGWHGTYHNKETGGGPSYPWKNINKTSLMLSTATRRDTLSKLSKIRILVKFLQGDTDDADVEKDVSHAWDVCKESARKTLEAQGITEWPLSGSYRTAYMALLRLQKEQKQTFDNLVKRTVDTTPKRPARIQTAITAYFNTKGQLEDMPDIEVDDNLDHDSIGGGASANSSDGSAVDLLEILSRPRPPQDCLICPRCPDSGGQKGRDLVVYRDSNALWQHWDKHHNSDQKPALWEIHRVLGAKLLQARTAPWLRVENALSFHAPDYEMQKLRQDIKSGDRKLGNGTYVELQPDQSTKNKGIRWFAVVRDGRVQDGKIRVQYCEENCQTILQGQNAAVWVESILRVGGGPNVPFLDVAREPRSARSPKSCHNKTRVDDGPASSPSNIGVRASKAAAASASCAPRSQPGLTTTSPAKTAQVLPSKSSSRACASSPEMIREPIVDKKIQKVTPASSTKTSPHDKMIQSIVAQIKQRTNNDEKALKQFDDANKNIERSGWSRCETMEQCFSYQNLTHPKYSVQTIPRDGLCMYHSMLNILKAEHETRAPTSAAALREHLAQYAENQEPSEGMEKGRHGGFFTDQGVYLPLEEPIRGTYGGQAALTIFVQMYGITVHCIAPESNANELFQKGDGKRTKQYYMLQTLSWNTWSQIKTYNSKKQEYTISYERNYAGDHWQLLEPAFNELQCVEVLQTKTIPASASSAAATAPKQPRPRAATIAPQTLKFNDSEKNATPERHTVSPSFTLGASTTEENHPASVNFMLREVSGTKKFLRNPIPDFASKMHNHLRVVTVKDMHFLEDDFGETYCMVYPSSVQHLLYAFPDLDECHRSFFICLGIGADLDPYTLQHTFRSHALRHLKNIRDVDQKIIQTLQPTCAVNWRVLQWCWPAALDAFRINVLDSNEVFVLQSLGTHKKSDMILRCHNQRYTLLHAIEGATAEGLRQKVRTTALRLSHETNKELKCQDISTFDEFFDSKCFVSAALQGTEPSDRAWDTMWKHASDAAGLDYDETSQKWTTMPPGLVKSKSKTKAFTDGSLHTTSWKELQQQLLSALNHGAASSAKDVTFMDAGSESGKGMYRMMSDKRITHVAGVELQQAWYDASCNIMSHIRAACKKENYRMPAVTIVRSCMVDPLKKELDYLYSIARIMWMNNFVFGRVEFFAQKKSNKSAPMPILQGNRDLTTNAALRFSRAFSGVTYIAVHITAGFLTQWNYKIFKQPFNMRVTWGTTKCEVTILQHNQPNIQRLEMTEGRDRKKNTRYDLPIPNVEELQLWDECMNKWNDLIPMLYKTISTETFYTDRLRGTQANLSELEKKEVVVLHSDDEPDASWRFADAVAASAASKLTQALPSATIANDTCDWTHLVALTDSNWLPSEIMDAYMNLLTKQFLSILFIPLNAGTINGKVLKQRKILVGYMNLNSNHWIAAKLDLKLNIAAIADSLHESFVSMHAAVFDKLQTWADKAGHTRILQRCTVTVPNQRNTNDCGVFACLFQLFMAQTVRA